MIDIKEEEIAEQKDPDFDIEELARAGLHFGHRTSRLHPKMKKYVYGVRNSVNIIDLEKTLPKLKETLSFIEEFISKGKVILFVGTKIQVKEQIKETAKECGLPYVHERWLGGTFTNFEVIKKKIDYFKELEKKRETGELEKYTKKERSRFDKELENLRIKFEGIKDMSRLPDAIFVADLKKDNLAIKEARARDVKVIGIADTNVNPDLVDFVIPANDDSLSAVRYVLDKIKAAVLRGKAKIKPEEQK